MIEVASLVIQAPALKDAPDSDDPDRHRQSLLNVHEHADNILGSALAHAVAVGLIAVALFYLFRATRYRRPELPSALRWLLLIAPLLLLVGSVLNQANLRDISDRFVEHPSLQAGPTEADVQKAKRECRERDLSRAKRDACVAREARRSKVAREDQLAEDLIDEEQSVLGGSLIVAGGLAVALLLVMVSLHAMRAGLLSRFMGILGIIAGVLQVLPLSPVPVVQIFWLGAVGALFSGRWPGGRGPAWGSGEAEPWPSAADMREGAVGDAVRKRFEQDEPELDTPSEPDAAQHPVSKKRKRKRRR